MITKMRKCLFICTALFILSINLIILHMHRKTKSLEISSFNQHLLTGEEPIIIWWSAYPHNSISYYQQCGEERCFITNKKSYQNNTRTEAFLFDGTFFNPKQLPLPRRPGQIWGLQMLESPKNNYLLSHTDIMNLFNVTSTFKRHSTFPVLLQDVESIEWLENNSFVVPVSEKNKFLSELSPITYVQSDCYAPSGRDKIVKKLMEYIKIDSYGQCLHNKDLPKRLVDPLSGMHSAEFYNLMAKYKFTIAIENSLCEDYITEKLWRTLHLGSVPIVLGSSKIRDFLPNKYSAIFIDDFKSIEELANYLNQLNRNDEEYEKYLEWKRTGVTNSYLKDILSLRNSTSPPGRFVCNVCKILHENINRKKSGMLEIRYKSNKSHYGCPGPVGFNVLQKNSFNSPYEHLYFTSVYVAKAVTHFVKLNRNYTAVEFDKYVSSIQNNTYM